MGLLSTNGRHYKRPPVWKRIIKWTLLFLLLTTLALAVAFYALFYRPLAKAKQNSSTIPGTETVKDIPPPDGTMNILLLGADDSPEGGSRRSDTMMLVRINPGEESVSILSIPRDLVADIPGIGPEKINAAYAHGDVPLAIETVKELTGQQIHHYVVVNLTGFEQAVDALGGIYMDIDQRYYNDNSDADWGYDEAYEPIDIQPGYQKLNGADALAFVRYRHTDSDFVRIARQQQFVNDAKAQSMQWGNILKIQEIAEVFSENTTTDIDPTDTISIANFLLKLDRDRIYQEQIPITDTGGYIAVDEYLMPDAMSRFNSPKFEAVTADGGTATTPAETSAATQASVEILNGNGVEGDASRLAELLRQKGYAQVEIGGNAQNMYYENQVYYREGGQAAADELASLVEPATVSPLPPGSPSKAQVVVVVGSAFSGTLSGAPAAAEPAAEPVLNFEDDPQNGRYRWEAAKLQLPFEVQKPTRFPVEFDYVDFRPYEIETDDGPRAALKVVCENQLGEPWGIMQTTFTEAPLLQAPSAEREIDGRTYKLFYVNDRLKYIAWQQGETVYWLSNTLKNTMSEGTMVELATSFRPV